MFLTLLSCTGFYVMFLSSSSAGSAMLAVGTSWRGDETYIKGRGRWTYLYRAVDQQGRTVDFLLSNRRNIAAAKQFFTRAIKQHGPPERITVAGYRATHPAISELKAKNGLPQKTEVRTSKYLHNLIEQDHRAIRRRWRAMQCFRSFHTAERTQEGIKALHMMRKGQVKRLNGRDSVGQAKFVKSLFGVAA